MRKRTENLRPVVSEDLNGLLRRHKEYNTYFKICANKSEKLIRLQMTNNPISWKNIPDEWNKNYFQLKRVELDVASLFANYIDPVHIVATKGPCVGIKLPVKQISIFNGLEDKENNFYLITAPIRFFPEMIQFIKKMIELPPQIKLQLIEKYIVGSY